LLQQINKFFVFEDGLKVAVGMFGIRDKIAAVKHRSTLHHIRQITLEKAQPRIGKLIDEA
jgi:hypothetical protein